VAQTQELVQRLIRENRALKLRNQKLTTELDRLSAGWTLIKKLASQAPRAIRRK
jgi:regulator of replication initiation timing